MKIDFPPVFPFRIEYAPGDGSQMSSMKSPMSPATLPASSRPGIGRPVDAERGGLPGILYDRRA